VESWDSGIVIASLLHLQFLTKNKAWSFLEPERLFHVYDPDDEAQNDAHHLANMTALLGPPPLKFLNRSSKSRQYWDENGESF
jgi:hypothetical protein